MSQIVTRKGPVGEDKEKGQSTETPVKEMKKKMAANAEKEKQAAEKHAEKEKEKDKPAETKQNDKAEKNVEKNSEKKEKLEKGSDKKEKQAEKEKVDRSVDKKSETSAEKPKEDKSAKQPEKPEEKDKDIKEKDKKRTDTPKPKQNGSRANGVPPSPAGPPTANGDHSDGTVSSDEELVIIDHERDDMFPELAYDDSDGEFEPPTPEGLPSRSYTRRSQAKAARTPETPRPASDKRADRDTDDSKESKVLKLKEDAPSTDRKLRSSDSPKPETKKPERSQDKKTGEKEKEADATRTADKPSPKKQDLEAPEVKDDEGKDKSTVEIVIDVDMDEGVARKDGTNYSRSRVKVSPYRRAADLTTSSVTANYTGNNTTMEMDITETSSVAEETPPVDSPYLNGLRSIRGRRSYKPLKEMALRTIGVGRSLRSTVGVLVTEQPSRPTAPVVGRKRKPEGDESIELATEAHEAAARSKRARILEKLSRPFRTAASTPLAVRRNAEIVGINTDLPLTAPVASPDTFDPESLKTTPLADAAPPAPVSIPVPGPQRDRDNKRCSVM